MSALGVRVSYVALLSYRPMQRRGSTSVLCWPGPVRVCGRERRACGACYGRFGWYSTVLYVQAAWRARSVHGRLKIRYCKVT